MYEIELTDGFDCWLNSLRDIQAKGFIVKRLTTMANGSLGETKSLGGGLHEAKIRHGQGYRLYFCNRKNKIIVLLCGGTKSTQTQDIKNARKMAEEI